MALRYAYNTNGAANHRLEDALELISGNGFDGVALTLDHHHFDPFAADFGRRAESLARTLENLKLGLVIETGARFLLNPAKKHDPLLISPDAGGRARRTGFLKLAIDLAEVTGAEAVSFWSGVKAAEVSREAAFDFLRAGLAELCAYAAPKKVCLAFEPEPGMLIETVADYLALAAEFPFLKIALDTGHCLASREGAPDNFVRALGRESLGTVAIEDMRRGVHEHLFFGEGEMDIPAVLASLAEIRYEKLICAELSRHSHSADKTIPAAIKYLREAESSLNLAASPS